MTMEQAHELSRAIDRLVLARAEQAVRDKLAKSAEELENADTTVYNMQEDLTKLLREIAAS